MERYYSGDGLARDRGKDLPAGKRKEIEDPAGYVADEGLVRAVHVSLTLGLPLLLSGEPGSGKSRLAHSLAYELGLGEVLEFETKSTSQSRDLFYHFDTLGFYHEQHRRQEPAQSGRAQRAEADSVRRFVHFQALGKAILRANKEPRIRSWLVKAGEAVPPPTRSVVLIDEVDKAPRDFPNDILNELERLYFRIPELAPELEPLRLEKLEAEPEWQPILILTSNSENDLPDTFLRRCVYYDLPFPNRAQLNKILSKRFPKMAEVKNGLCDDAVAFFLHLREDRHKLQKRPSCSELLCWLLLLQNWGWQPAQRLQELAEQVPETLNLLAKTKADHEKLIDLWDKWQKSEMRPGHGQG